MKIRNTNITLKTNMRVLGVIFTRNALWNEQVKNIVNKLNQIHNLLKIICGVKNGPYIESALSICRSLVEGAVQLCVAFYGCTSEENKKKIYTAINKCFITACGLLSATPLDANRVEARYKDFSGYFKADLRNQERNLLHPLHMLYTIASGNT